MQVRSLAVRTDLMLIRWDGIVDENDGAIRAHTPSNPDFYFGNFLLFPDAPGPGDAEAWPARFRAAFAGDPRIRHVCLRWDRPDGARGEASALEASGYFIEETVALVTASPRLPPRPNREVTLRRIESDADWDAVTALQIATMTEEYGAGAEDFARNDVARHRRSAVAGGGAWYGAFAGNVLAADLGIFVDGGVGRFQSVETAAAFRRRGICGTLLHHAAQAALTELGAATLVIVGVPGHVSAVYESCGFTPQERLVSALLRPVRRPDVR